MDTWTKVGDLPSGKDHKVEQQMKINVDTEREALSTRFQHHQPLSLATPAKGPNLRMPMRGAFRLRPSFMV